MPHKKTHPDQLDFALPREEVSGALHSHGIFTSNYLQRHFARTANFPPVAEIERLYGEARVLWEEKLPGLIKQKEAYTRTAFLDPLLAALGWHFIPEANLPHGPTRKRPDYALLRDATRSEQAAAAADATDIFRLAETVLEAKRWQHPLDEASSSETPGWFPSEQIQDYLRHAKDATGARFFHWAILTNGARWRLYCEQAAGDAFFEFTLAHGESFCSLEDFRFFVALFRPGAFERQNGRCLLDQLREEALTRQVALEKNLKDRIFDVLEDLATGYRANAENRIAPADFPALYETALVFLYRLLFVLYAESRGLLPVKARGHRGNAIYSERYSLARLVPELKGRAKFTDDAFTDLYDALLKSFDLINGTYPDRNSATGVTRYNGGLFSPHEHPCIAQWKVGDATLADVLRLLIFDQPAGKNRRQRAIQTDDSIDYASLEVRQLGDIYEGLLGAELRERADARLELINANGQNHRQGIFYTPDWIVLYLLRETLAPLLTEIEASPDVARALSKKNDEQRGDNSFAIAVLRLRFVDPAMGSGHFLVRGTEFLARKIREHPTTKLMTEQIVANGGRQRTREQILADHRHPVPPGVSQEQAETSYWRRRVVESCIHGVDLNPMAVELAKLSLWLTCIAAEEPLNFLDHHLRHGNSLVFAAPSQLPHLPIATSEEKKQGGFTLGDHLPAALAHVIKTNAAITGTPSTAMEEVKQKEDAWKKVRTSIAPFLTLADLWLASGDALIFADEPGKPARTLNELDYQTCARALVAPEEIAALPAKERKKAESLRDGILAALAPKRRALDPFHWHLEFPAVFYTDDGTPRDDAGFDAVLGNPPYISTQTSSAEAWRAALERRDGWLDDLYVHFSALGFALLREGGGFGFIVSDTFFTLATKLRMRALLQRHRLTHLGQCDPFDATVDAAIFVARKRGPEFSPAVPISAEEFDAKFDAGEDITAWLDISSARVAEPGAEVDAAFYDDSLLFIQARPRTGTAPYVALDTLPPRDDVIFSESSETMFGKVAHGTHTQPGHTGADLRVHRVPLALYRATHKRAFFEPRPGTLRLWEKFNSPVKALVAEWWERIKDSKAFDKNRDEIAAYQRTLMPGDITLVGLIAEGGQGMRTANNGRFLGYLEDTRQAEVLIVKRAAWAKSWLADAAIAPVFRQLLADAGGDAAKPLKDGAAWESCVEPLRQQFGDDRLGIGKTDLYRIVPRNLVADGDDFRFAWQRRKPELLARWQTHEELGPFWHTTLDLDLTRRQLEKLHKAKTVTDEDFIALCREIQRWAAGPPNGKRRAPREAVGLRSSEDYTDADDAPRIATIYNGLSGRGRFVPYRKGDPDGNQWLTSEPLFIDWSQPSVRFLFDNSGRREERMPVVRNAALYFTSGVTYSLHGNHVPVKARLQDSCVFDAGGSRMTPPKELLTTEAFLAILNSNAFSFFLKKFIKHNQDVEINDVRMMPVIMPTKDQAKRLEMLAGLAFRAKRHDLDGTHPDNALVAAVRPVEAELFARGPAYLHPGAQQKLLATAADCLAVLERAVSWEAEKLYGVEALGPFDEF